MSASRGQSSLERAARAHLRTAAVPAARLLVVNGFLLTAAFDKPWYMYVVKSIYRKILSTLGWCTQLTA
jgi:hypothetical protein